MEDRMEDLSVTKHGFALLHIPYETHMFCELFYIYIRMKFWFWNFIPYCLREKKYSFHYFFRSTIPTGRDSRMTQEVGSSCSTPWLFFQTFWSFFLSSLNYTNNSFSWEKQHRNALIYTVIDQKRGSVSSLWKNRECAISFFPVAFYYKVVSSSSSKFSHTWVKVNFFLFVVISEAIENCLLGFEC